MCVQIYASRKQIVRRGNVSLEDELRFQVGEEEGGGNGGDFSEDTVEQGEGGALKAENADCCSKRGISNVW